MFLVLFGGVADVSGDQGREAHQPVSRNAVRFDLGQEMLSKTRLDSKAVIFLLRSTLEEGDRITVSGVGRVEERLSVRNLPQSERPGNLIKKFDTCRLSSNHAVTVLII